MVVHLAGALDLSSKARVVDLLAQARALPVSSLVLDVSEVTFIDCVGLGVLLGARADLGDRLRLRSPSAPVARLLVLTDTHSRFDITPASHPHARDDGDHGTGGPAAAQVVAGLGQLTVDQPPRLLLQQAVDLAAGVLPGVDGLCLALAHEGHLLQAAFVRDLAASLDERQYGRDVGPCSHAARTGQPVDLDLDAEAEADLDADLDVGAVDDEDGPGAEGWGDFTALARRKGVREVHAVPVAGGQRVVGALVLYTTTTTGPIDPGARAAAHGFAHAAGGLLANVLLHRAALRKVGQLEEAMASRALIEQAKGVLMAVHGIDADAAFDRLARTSQATNTKLRDLAADLLARTRE